MEAGFDHFIRKPMTKAMLAALLEQAIPGEAIVRPSLRPEEAAHMLSF
jgi:hypothetical protein